MNFYTRTILCPNCYQEIIQGGAVEPSWTSTGIDIVFNTRHVCDKCGHTWNDSPQAIVMPACETLKGEV